MTKHKHNKNNITKHKHNKTYRNIYITNINIPKHEHNKHKHNKHNMINMYLIQHVHNKTQT